MEDQSLLIVIGLPVALFIIMVGIGLTLTVRDFQREAEHPKGMVVGAVGQILVMPLLGFLVVMLFGLSGALAVGVVIVAACPGGATSNLICFLGRANVALSIALTVIASLITVITLPLFTEFAIDWQGLAATGVELPVLETIVRLIVIVIIPVIIGMTIRNRNADLANRAERLVSLFGAIVLVVLIIGIAIGLWEDVPTYLRQAGPAVIILNVAGIVVGMVSGRLTGLSRADSLTLGMELGVKNATVGILIATLISSTDFTYAVPSAAYGLLMYVSAAALVAYGRRQWQATADAAAAAD